MSAVVRNIVANWAGVAVNLVVAFLLSPFLVHSLGDRAYGLWVLVLSFTGYMGLLDTGLRIAIVKHTAEYNARGDSAGLNRTLLTGLTLYGSLSVVVMILAVIAAVFFERLFVVSPEEASLGRVLVLIAGLNVALSLPLGVLGGLLAGLQRFDLLNRATIIVLLAQNGDDCRGDHRRLPSDRARMDSHRGAGVDRHHSHQQLPQAVSRSSTSRRGASNGRPSAASTATAATSC